MPRSAVVQRVVTEAPSGLLVCRPSLKLAFDPAAWDDHQQTTNCLTYALNCPNMGWMRPGGLRDHYRKAIPKDELSVTTLRTRLLEDLIEITRDEALSSRFHVIAMLAKPGEDVHFLRRESDGLWSHKLGDWRPHCLDSEHYKIHDPEKAVVYHYGQFGGYFTIPPEGILYKPCCPRELCAQ
jgi:hypothetical protein